MNLVMFLTEYMHYYGFHDLCSWESKKSSFNDGIFITWRNFWNEQALSADVVYNDAVHTQCS